MDENGPQPLGPSPPPCASHPPLGGNHTGHGTGRRCHLHLPCLTTKHAGIIPGVAQEGLSRSLIAAGVGKEGERGH